MKQNCSCGFIIAERTYGQPIKWLLCHPTNGGNRWDIPKGMAEKDENHLDAAIRELEEETGLILEIPIYSSSDFEHNRAADDFGIIDLGQHSYADKKDLHLFYMEVNDLNTHVMICRSMVVNKNGPNFPEMDGFGLFNIDKVSQKIGNSLNKWINAYVPRDLLDGWVGRA
jgi:predicted NUDIX family NTP pyrophosphohydrolase